MPPNERVRPARPTPRSRPTPPHPGPSHPAPSLPPARPPAGGKPVFSLLEPGLRELVGQRFEAPTPIQELVIPEILSGRNVLVLSETGSGKTEACLLPVLSLWSRVRPKANSILYITPLKSLNRDLHDRILWWSSRLGFDVSVRHGDTTQYERKMQAENPPDMLIVTPETLQAVLVGPLLRSHLKNVRFVIIDEVHELVTSKRGLQLAVGLERLKELISSSGNPAPQMITLSATVGTPERIVEFFSLCPDGREAGGSGKPSSGKAGALDAGIKPSSGKAGAIPGEPQAQGGVPERREWHGCSILNSASSKMLSLRVESPPTLKDDHSLGHRMYAGAPVVSRVRRIRELIGASRSVLAFTNTREFAEVLSSRLRTLDASLKVDTHHSSLSRDARIQAEDDFKKGALKSLVCTSSLELGIDIGQVDLVIQYQSPRQVSKLLQRVGRSGHSLSRVSDGVIISGEPDDLFESSVIASHGLMGLIEPTRTYGPALDVLAHQAIGLALEEYGITQEKAFGIIRRAHPFRDLTWEEFQATLKLVQKLGFLWTESKFSEVPILRRRKRSWEHYYGNLSTIPDVRNYKVIDIMTNKAVGSLDAEFIALHGSPGSAFITKGQAWRIVEVYQSKVVVEPMAGLHAAIPAWEGELIPVPFDVAQGVAGLREEIASSLPRGKGPVTGSLMKAYPVTREVAEGMFDLVRRQAAWGPVPTGKSMLAEYFADDNGSQVIFHTCWGSLVNDTIGRALSTLLTARLGSVGFSFDPYRIVVKLQPMADWKPVIETFRGLQPRDLEAAVRGSIPGTELFMWRFIHVAKRFGIITRDADYGKAYVRKLLEVYRDTPAWREALNEVERDKLDLPRASELLGQVRSGAIGLEVRQGPSPLADVVLSRRYEIIAPDRPEKEIFSLFSGRLMDTTVGLVCYNCGKWATIYGLKDVPERPHCPLCEATMISVAPHRHLVEAQELIRKRLSGARVKPDEKRYLDMLLDSASLVAGSGKDAIVAMSGRGVGLKTAGRILSKQLKGDDLLREVLEAEKRYVRTRKFWRG
jgi:ATP-dependent Lhr-like helicase